MPTISPLNMVQEQVLRSNCDFVAMTGAVYGGKTFLGSWIPAYRIKNRIGKGMMYLRVNDRNFKDPGGFFDKFKDIYNLKVHNEKTTTESLVGRTPIGTLNTTMPALAKFINGYECHFKSVYRFDKQTLESLFKSNETDCLVADECEDFTWHVINYAQTRLRGGVGIKRQVYMIQNPERECFIRRICGSGANGGGWIGDDGYVKPNMSGVVRYFFNPRGNENEFYWGDSPDEVYSKCKAKLDAMLKGKMKWQDAIMSFVFYDVPLLQNDMEYLGRLLGSSAFSAIADVNWNYSKYDADDEANSIRELKVGEVSSAYRQPRSEVFSRTFMTVDAAGTTQDDDGTNQSRRSDNMVCCLWGLNQYGLHCIDLQSWMRPHITDVKNNIRHFRDKHGLQDSQLIIDMQGLGALLLDDFPRARKSNAANEISNRGQATYANAKSEHIGIMCKGFHNGIITFNPKLITQEYEHTRIAKGTTVLHQMMLESRALIFNTRKDGKLEVIPKLEMKKYIKGFSPDIYDNVMMAVGAHIYDMYKLLSDKTATNLVPNDNNISNMTIDEYKKYNYIPNSRRGSKISNFSKRLNSLTRW